MAVAPDFIAEEPLLYQGMAVLSSCQFHFYFLIVFPVHSGPLVIYQQPQTDKQTIKYQDYQIRIPFLGDNRHRFVKAMPGQIIQLAWVPVNLISLIQRGRKTPCHETWKNAGRSEEEIGSPHQGSGRWNLSRSGKDDRRPMGEEKKQ